MSRLAVIVGAGPGVGAAVARALGRKGFDIGLIARDGKRLTRLGEALQAEGITTGWAEVDAGDPDALTSAVDGFGGRAGRIDVVHHNAVASRAEPATTLSPRDLVADLMVGAASLLAATQAALPYMREGGLVLATGSGAANRPMPGAVSIGVQKAALRNLVTALDVDLRERGVRAASVTVNGTIEAGTAFDPDHIAAEFVRLVDHFDAGAAEWKTTVAFNGAG